MLIILFGLAGSGKNFIGETLKTHFNYYYWDADEALPIEMQNAIQNKQVFTQSMRDNLTKAIINKISYLKSLHPNLVISQALYKEKNRQDILNHFPEATFIYVKTSKNLILHRLKARHGAVDNEYADLITQQFEQPVLKHFVLDNDSTQIEVINQLKSLLNKK